MERTYTMSEREYHMLRDSINDICAYYTSASKRWSDHSKIAERNIAQTYCDMAAEDFVRTLDLLARIAK